MEHKPMERIREGRPARALPLKRRPGYSLDAFMTGTSGDVFAALYEAEMEMRVPLGGLEDYAAECALERAQKQQQKQKRLCERQAKSAETGAALTTFTCFGRLPPELRDLIWQAADPMIDFRVGRSRFDCVSPRDRIPAPPVLLSVCRESRELALRTGQWFDPDDPDSSDEAEAAELAKKKPRRYWCQRDGVETIYLPTWGAAAPTFDGHIGAVTAWPGRVRRIATDAIYLVNRAMAPQRHPGSDQDQPPFFSAVGCRCDDVFSFDEKTGRMGRSAGGSVLSFDFVLTHIRCEDAGLFGGNSTTRVVALDDPALPGMLLPLFQRARHAPGGRFAMLHPRGVHAYIAHLRAHWESFVLPVVREDWLRTLHKLDPATPTVDGLAPGHHPFAHDLFNDDADTTLFTGLNYGTIVLWPAFNTAHPKYGRMLARMPDVGPAVVFEKGDPGAKSASTGFQRCSLWNEHLRARRLCISEDQLEKYKRGKPKCRCLTEAVYNRMFYSL